MSTPHSTKKAQSLGRLKENKRMNLDELDSVSLWYLY